MIFEQLTCTDLKDYFNSKMFENFSINDAIVTKYNRRDRGLFGWDFRAMNRGIYDSSPLGIVYSQGFPYGDSAKEKLRRVD